MLNKTIIQGRLVKDPEMRQTQSGLAVSAFTVACERSFSADGERVTDFIDCVAWRKTAEFVCNYFHRGDMILVDGRLQSRKYEDRDGNKRTAWEVVVDTLNFGGSKNSNYDSQAAASAESHFVEEDEPDNDLPF